MSEVVLRPHFSLNVADERRMADDGVERSPFSLPVRRSNTGKTCSRKRLLP